MFGLLLKIISTNTYMYRRSSAARQILIFGRSCLGGIMHSNSAFSRYHYMPGWPLFGFKPWSNGLASTRKLQVAASWTCEETWLGGQTVKNLYWLACKFDLDQSDRKSTQVHARPAKRSRKYTQVFNLRLLASPFDQGFKENKNLPVQMEKRNIHF